MYYFKTFKRNKYWFDFFLLKRGWALLLLLQFLCKIVQTTWKKTLFFWQRLSPRYKCPVAACCGLGTRRWGGGAWGHSVSWQKLADQAPWRHVSHHHWESADRQTAGRWRWRRGEGEREKERKERDRSQALCNIWCSQVYNVPSSALKTSAQTRSQLQPAQSAHSDIQIVPGNM